MALSLLRAVIAAGLCALSAHVCAAPSVNMRIDYYPVSGNTLSQLRQAMNASGPFDPASGRRFDARTNWQVAWRIWVRQAQGQEQCSIERIKVDLMITYILPRLSDDARLSGADRARWESDWAALKLHEDGHAQHGRDAADAVEYALLRMPPQPCAKIEASSNEVGRRVVEDFIQRDAEYDRRTEHGAKPDRRLP